MSVQKGTDISNKGLYFDEIVQAEHLQTECTTFAWDHLTPPLLMTH